jgi:hypothetical protein
MDFKFILNAFFKRILVLFFKMRLKNGKFFPMVYLEKYVNVFQKYKRKKCFGRKTNLIKNFSLYFIYFYEFKNDIFNLLRI